MSFRAKPTIEIDVPEPAKAWPDAPQEEQAPPPAEEPATVPERELEEVPA